MNLIALGISHNSAAVEVRERVAFAPEQVGEALVDACDALRPAATNLLRNMALPDRLIAEIAPDTAAAKITLSRTAFAERIASCAQGGRVAVFESGRDCDGVEYSGKRHLIDATLAAFEALDDSIGEWADGPYRLRVAHISESEQYSSRDLVLEAFEDGHRHVIYSKFP